MDRRGGGEERRVPHEEGAQGALGEEWGALRGDVLAASHAVVDLEVQGLVLLLDSGREEEEEEKKEIKSEGQETGVWGGEVFAYRQEGGVMHPGTGGTRSMAAHTRRCCAAP